jgi:hypothetical protein
MDLRSHVHKYALREMVLYTYDGRHRYRRPKDHKYGYDNAAVAEYRDSSRSENCWKGIRIIKQKKSVWTQLTQDPDPSKDPDRGSKKVHGVAADMGTPRAISSSLRMKVTLERTVWNDEYTCRTR